MPAPHAPNHVPAPGDWFPVIITDEPTTGEFTFAEVALDGNGDWDVKTGGRTAGERDPGYPLTGTLAVDDYALARSAPTAGGNLWELLPLAGSVSAWKEPVRVATTVNGTDATAFENGDTIDGVTLATGDRILRKNQSAAAENGIFVVNATGAPTRAADADAGGELVGAVVWVSEGTANKDTIWACTTNAPITVGTTATVWVQVYPQTAAALSYVERAMDSTSYTVTAVNAWENVNDGTDVSISLTAGTWLVMGHVTGRVLSFVTLEDDSSLFARLYNSTDSAAVPGTQIIVTDSVSVFEGATQETVTAAMALTSAFSTVYIVASGTKVLKLQAALFDAGSDGAYDGEILGELDEFGTGSENVTRLTAVRIA